MAVRLSREQRDAVYGEVLLDLTGTGDIYLKLAEGDFEGARRLRRRFEDDMRLLDDLGWEPDADGEAFEVSMAPAELGRIVRHLANNARSTVHTHVVESVEQADPTLRAITAQAAYGDLLGQIVVRAQGEDGEHGRSGGTL